MRTRQAFMIKRWTNILKQVAAQQPVKELDDAYQQQQQSTGVYVRTCQVTMTRWMFIPNVPLCFHNAINRAPAGSL